MSKEDERSRQDRRGQELAAEEARTWFDFFTLSMLKSARQPGKYLEILTQIWDPPGEATCRPKEDEGSQQEVRIRTDGPHFTDTSSEITEWEGPLYLRPFRLSEVLERHLLQHHEDDQSAPSPKAADKNQQLGKEQFEEMNQLYTPVGIYSPPAAANERQPNLQDEIRHGNGPTAIPHQVSGQTQQPIEKRFLVVSTIYGAIHLLAQGSNLLVNVTNIANIFGHSRILPFKGRPSPILSLARELDMRLQGSYYTIKSALQFCDLLSAQTDATQANHAIGQVLKEMLQRGYSSARQ
ncbi:hypothetical protein K469DRAFT_683425 [Zopfia rhizophila CBS 207.26]|uniref:Uncharacterized protein n=1 Tax=Zopfia rhizophila CBS 207.26 TaxID=1314779 RepID=A0A6A6DBE2_9PEZI|nr:hypothetical protein K469DRAFT_683425 [Zopfia rhizophila CBS 207.26]